MFEWGGTKIAVGSATMSTSAPTTVNLGFRPKYLACRMTNASQGNFVVNVYDERHSTTASVNAGTSSYLSNVNLGNSTQNRITSITDTGFVINRSSQSAYLVLEYFAIG